MSRPEVVDRELEAIDDALAGRPVAFEHAELEALVLDVRATAPPMPPALAARLDELAGAPAPPLRRPRSWLRAPLALTAAAALIVALVVAATTLHGGGSSNSGSFSSSGSSGSSAGDSKGAPAVRSSGSGSASSAAPRPAAPSRGPRRVERDTSLALVTRAATFADVTDGVVRTTDRIGGIVQSSNVSQQGRSGHADFALRFRTSRLDEAMAALSRLAHVRSRSASALDITAPFDTAERRLADARALRTGILRALENATTEEQIAALRARLRDANAAIDRDRAAVARLRNRSDFATVNVSVDIGRLGAVAGRGGGTWTPGDALREAGRILQVGGGVAIVGLAIVLPPALLAALAAFAVRAARRRRREHALDAV
jgi:uncharacterized protein DUF4349